MLFVVGADGFLPSLAAQSGAAAAHRRRFRISLSLHPGYDDAGATNDREATP
jgi:hypothetical protein